MFAFRFALRERLLSYARHCRRCLFQCCGLVRQRNRTMVDGSAQSGARLSFSDICWNDGHVCRGCLWQYVVEGLCLLCEGVRFAVVRCVMATFVFVFRYAERERLLSYARHFRCWYSFQCCGLVRQRNRTMVDGSAQSGARCSFSDICWNGGHFRGGYWR